MYLTKTKKMILVALFAAIAIIISSFEMYILPATFLPGVKLGIANIVTLVAFYIFGGKIAVFISLFRVIIVSALFGNGSSFLYSFMGALLSALAMCLFYKNKNLSPIGVSLIGSFFHVFGQIICSFFILKSSMVFYYFPMILFFGIITGFLIGVIANYFLRKWG